MLIICAILVSVDVMEIYRLLIQWQNSKAFSHEIFQSCIKNELLLKTVFSIFSMAAAVCAFLLTALLVISVEFFLEKILKAYLNMVYFIFGPYMLGFCILGLAHWDDIMYICDPRNMNLKIFSLGNMLSLIICFVISICMTLGSTIYGTIVFYIDSITARPDGSKFLRSAFWWIVLRTSGTNFLSSAARNVDEDNGNNGNNGNNFNNGNNGNNGEGNGINNNFGNAEI